MRSTGTRWSLSVDTHYEELPVPRPDSERPLDEFPINEKHGLYGFFNKEKQVVLPDEAEDTHGRSWKYRELMNKSFEELHQLYWACILEGNRIATRYGEHKRMKLAYGQLENRNRANTVSHFELQPSMTGFPDETNFTRRNESKDCLSLRHMRSYYEISDTFYMPLSSLGQLLTPTLTSLY